MEETLEDLKQFWWLAKCSIMFHIRVLTVAQGEGGEAQLLFALVFYTNYNSITFISYKYIYIILVNKNMIQFSENLCYMYNDVCNGNDFFPFLSLSFWSAFYRNVHTLHSYALAKDVYIYNTV